MFGTFFSQSVELDSCDVYPQGIAIRHCLWTDAFRAICANIQLNYQRKKETNCQITRHIPSDLIRYLVPNITITIFNPINTYFENKTMI